MRTVVISGGGTGIGRAVAARFAESNEHVALLGRRPEVLRKTAAELTAEHPEALVTVHPVDLTDPSAVADCVATLPAQVDVLVNNAGGTSRADLGAGLAGVAAAWRADLEQNVLTAVLLTTALADRLTSPGGRVVLLGSIAGFRGAGSYGAAKAALLAYNASLAGELGPRGITVNLVAPGYVMDTEFFGAAMTEERHERLIGQTLVGKAGEPQDVAGAIAYFAGADAGHVTGTVLHVNGGALVAF